MKVLYILILFFFSFNMSAQHAVKDSVVYLKEVTGKQSEGKIIKVKTRGEELAATFEGGTQSRICLVDNIPEGKLQSVKLYFNSGLINLAKRSLNVKYEDTELKLMLYEAAADGNPGNKLIDEDMRFIVKKEHKRGIELDVSSLNIRTISQFFIGVELIKETTGYTPIVLKVVANNDGVTYLKNNKDANWNKDTVFPNQIKLELKITE